nr:hypothetical protein [Tanacetum cinerariifolium]
MNSDRVELNTRLAKWVLSPGAVPYRFQRAKPMIVDPGLLKDEICFHLTYGTIIELFQRAKPVIVDPGLLKDEACQRHLNCLQG